MRVYRCFFLNDEDHIGAAEIIEADAVGAAIEKACAMLRERPQHRAVELWEAGRRLYRGDKRRDRTGQKSPEFSRAEKDTIPFLRMTAHELRRIAADAPDVAARLRVVADKLDAEANDLALLAEQSTRRWWRRFNLQSSTRRSSPSPV